MLLAPSYVSLCISLGYKRFLNAGPAINTGFVKLRTYGFCRDWVTKVLIQFCDHFWGPFVCVGELRLAATVCLAKLNNFAVYVTNAPAIWGMSIWSLCLF